MSHTNPLFAGFRVREGGLWLSDTTIADVSTSKHGFCPKAPNDTTKFLRGDGTWAVPAGGGSGYPPDSPDTPPGTPDSADDEFDDGSGMSGLSNGLDASWSWINQGSASIAYANNAAVLTCPANGAATNSLRGIVRSIGSTPWKVRGKFSARGPDAQYWEAGIWIRNSSNGKLISCSPVRTVGARLEVNRWTNATTYSATPLATNVSWPLILLPMYWECENDGTNITFRFSYSGIEGSFYGLYTETLATHIGTADQAGFFSNAALAGFDINCACSWFRRIS